MTESSSAQLLARYQAGDDAAADGIYQRYVARLTALARSRLSPRLARRVDSEDVVLSAYRSFFVRARRGEYALVHGGDLWRLLVAITLHKAHRQAAHHSAARRDMRRESAVADADPTTSTIDQIAGREPIPAEAAALIEEFEAMLNGLTPLERHIFELRLQGRAHDEIAARIDRSERTVRRVLDEIRGNLTRRLEHPSAN